MPETPVQESTKVGFGFVADGSKAPDLDTRWVYDRAVVPQRDLVDHSDDKFLSPRLIRAEIADVKISPAGPGPGDQNAGSSNVNVWATATVDYPSGLANTTNGSREIEYATKSLQDFFLSQWDVSMSVGWCSDSITCEPYSDYYNLSFCSTASTTSGGLTFDPVLVAQPAQPTKVDRLRARIKKNMAGFNGNYRYLTRVAPSDPEYKARGLLMDMIGDGPFRNYLKRGFVTVRGRTGLMYKVMRGQASNAIKSFAPTKDGKYRPFESICVVFEDRGLPPTDTVIMRLMMCLYDEFGMRAVANVWPADHGVKEEEFELGEFDELLEFRRGESNGGAQFELANVDDWTIRGTPACIDDWTIEENPPRVGVA